MKNNFKLKLILLVIIFAFSACSSVPYQTYQGPALDKRNVSIIKNTYRLVITSGDRIKITKIDDIEIPIGHRSFEILPGKHLVQACYSEEYTCGIVRDAWGGNCCSIYGHFNIEYDFTPGDHYELEVKPIKKYFAFQEIQVFIKNLTRGSIELLELRGANLGLDCYKDGPDTNELLGGQCF
jgi:hypothetical protein